MSNHLIPGASPTVVGEGQGIESVSRSVEFPVMKPKSSECEVTSMVELGLNPMSRSLERRIIYHGPR